MVKNICLTIGPSAFYPFFRKFLFAGDLENGMRCRFQIIGWYGVLEWGELSTQNFCCRSLVFRSVLYTIGAKQFLFYAISSEWSWSNSCSYRFKKSLKSNYIFGRNFTVFSDWNLYCRKNIPNTLYHGIVIKENWKYAWIENHSFVE